MYLYVWVCGLSIEKEWKVGDNESRERLISFFVQKVRINECLLSSLFFFLVYVRLKEDEEDEENQMKTERERENGRTEKRLQRVNK